MAQIQYMQHDKLIICIAWSPEGKDAASNCIKLDNICRALHTSRIEKHFGAKAARMSLCIGAFRSSFQAIH